MEQIVPRATSATHDDSYEKTLHSVIEDLQHQLAVAHRVEASLRAEVTELRANDARWAKRLKALEARLEHIGQIAAGHALVEGDEEGSAEG